MTKETLEDWRELAQALRSELDEAEASNHSYHARLEAAEAARAKAEGMRDQLRADLTRIDCDWPDFEDMRRRLAATTGEVARLREALRRWKCATCMGGQRVVVAHHKTAPCEGCGGTGLHPTASAALAPPAVVPPPLPDDQAPYVCLGCHTLFEVCPDFNAHDCPKCGEKVCPKRLFDQNPPAQTRCGTCGFTLRRGDCANCKLRSTLPPPQPMKEPTKP